ncbi:serine protease inhibitor 28Dc-like [Eupeodes corollae]|uniref:serine protease inhibitor 28Dc-like n=1 Tax=Eupeodes corollae TaxID=290404 RepID=UPI0024903067|nr:serine protease inhibitor 28Dc-like [Eupeodes corollae]XP_055915806.1 serine protease inhibitor 28Dc-like [Eupeodes corollae]XP_055915807.1 serine protease inhibitor 28Dc-like [Eupeodes corollae]
MGLIKELVIGCLLGVLALTISTAAEDNPGPIIIPEKLPDIPYDQKTSELVAQSVMNFAHNLAVALDTNEYPNTQIFSPLSVMSALSILQMGANGNSYNQLSQLFALLKGDGENASKSSKIHEEFGSLLVDVMQSEGRFPKRSRSTAEWRLKPFTGHSLGFGGKNDLGDHTVRVSNALFIQNGFSLKPDYAYAAQSVYKSEVTPLDFVHYPEQSKDYINSWVKQNTLGKIPTLIDDELSSETKMVLASTLYFQGFWEKVFFDADDYIKQAFYPDGPESYPVGITFMNNGGTFPYYLSEEHNCRILGLPYKGNQTTMYVIQPLESTRLKLQQLQKKLTGELINELISKMEYRTVTFAFPKFHVENKMHLKAALKRMGIEDIFVDRRSDLALIADPEENSLPTKPKIAPLSEFAASIVPIPEDIISSSLSSASSKTAPSSSSSLFSDAFDRFGDAPLIFSRFSEDSNNQTTGNTDRPDEMVETTTLVDELSQEETTLIPEEIITTLSPEVTSSQQRKRREAVPLTPSLKSLQKLDEMRSNPEGLKNPNLYVDEIVHKIDFNINEKGTEAAAATAGFLLKTGPDVSMRCDTPFLILVRHDPTKLPLFYGIINIPV